MKILSYLVLVALANGDEPFGSSFPSASPSGKPSGSSFPSAMPSRKPSGSSSPSAIPSSKPSGSSFPSVMPSSTPSGSSFPSSMPSSKPSGSSFPSAPPSGKPSGSSAPSAEPSGIPSSHSLPSAEPSDIPSLASSSAESLASLSPQTWDLIGSILEPTLQPVFDFSAIVPFARTSSPTVTGVGASLPVTGTGGPVAVLPVAVASGSPVPPSASAVDTSYFDGAGVTKPSKPKVANGNGKASRTNRGQGKKGMGARTRLSARTYDGRE